MKFRLAAARKVNIVSKVAVVLSEKVRIHQDAQLRETEGEISVKSNLTPRKILGYWFKAAILPILMICVAGVCTGRLRFQLHRRRTQKIRTRTSLLRSHS